MKAEYIAVKMHPISPFHLGEQGIGLEETAAVIHSDTLFSAIVNTYLRCFGREDLEENLIIPLAERHSPPFLLSTAFPFAFDVHFFPRPFLRAPLAEAIEPKKLKAVKFVSQDLFQRLIQGESSGETAFLQGGDLWTTREEGENLLEQAARVRGWKESDAVFWNEQEVPRVSLDRVTDASEIFYFSKIVFSQGCGFSFLIRYLDESLRERLERTIGVLGDVGVGGDRTAGYGQFQPEFSPFTMQVPEADSFVTLSLHAPRAEEIGGGLLDGQVSYNLVTRDGWIFSPEARNYRRRTARMFSEGSVLRGAPSALYGRAVDVTPEIALLKLSHRVYRYGYAFPVPACVSSRSD